MKTFEELIMQARYEALRRDMRANMILLDEEIATSKIFPIRYWIGQAQAKMEIPLIFGLKAAIDTHHVLPDEAAFAIFESENAPRTKDERIKDLEAEIKKLHRIIRDIAKRINQY